MNNIRLLKKIKEVATEEYNNFYENLVVMKIRKRYTINQELAIQRQRYTKPEQYAEYDNYIEQCKAEAKAEMEGA